jgi:uncharacterized protein (TIGR02421 family)
LRNSHAPDLTIPDDLMTEIRGRLDTGERIRRTLPGGGRLHVDRPLPFLCVYRSPIDGDDTGTKELVSGEASFLIGSASTAARKSVSKLVQHVAESMCERFGAFLIVEIWSASDADLLEAVEESELEPTELRPSFMIAAKGPNTPLRTVASLRRHLERITYLKQRASVSVNQKADGHPSALPSLLTTKTYRRLGCDTIGLRVRPIYRSHETGELYPAVLRSLKKNVGKALKQAFFTFAKNQTTAKPEHYYSLGRRAMVKAVQEADKGLSDVADSFSFLLQVTPVNAEAAWHECRRCRFEVIPKFYYRPLAIEPGVLKRRLFDIRIERIEDPTLAEMFRQRQDELDRKITMMTDIGTPRFVLGSQQVFGGVESSLVELAKQLLFTVASRSRDESNGGILSASEFAKLAENEIEYYRQQLPEFTAQVIVRDDMFSGLMCSDGDLLIGAQAKIPRRRAEALLQHEVGTHLLTYYNGLVEPFRLLHSGFAGYDSLQEGLAVLTEYLVGGLSRPRLRLLAARVVAADLLLQGATFVETFRTLDREYDFSQRTAYTVTMRIYRGGGLTKDAVYLRGLVEVLAYLGRGGELEPLLVGKIARDHIGLIRELLHRKVIQPPALQPRYLELAGVSERLKKLSEGMTVLELVKG